MIAKEGIFNFLGCFIEGASINLETRRVNIREYIPTGTTGTHRNTVINDVSNIEIKYRPSEGHEDDDPADFEIYVTGVKGK